MSKTETVLLTATYRPPQTNAEDYVDLLKEYLEQSKKCDVKYHIPAGDMNINILKSNDELLFKYLNTLSEYNFISMINKLTRVQESTGSCIDHIFLRKKNEIAYEKCIAVIIRSSITDHFATYLQLPIETEKKVEYEVYKKIINYTKLKKEIENFTAQCRTDDTEICTTHFIAQLERAISKNTKTVKLKQKKLIENPGSLML